MTGAASKREGGKREIGIFITHPFHVVSEWEAMGELFAESDAVDAINYSVAWYDPGLDPNTEIGEKAIGEWLESQIIPVDVVVLLSSLVPKRLGRRWIDEALKYARPLGKPVIGVPPGPDATEVSEAAAALCDATAPWSVEGILAAYDRVLASRGGAQAAG